MKKFDVITLVGVVVLMLTDTTVYCTRQGRITTLSRVDDFVIQKPLVQAFRPKGLRVSIPHSEGMEIFAFHGKVNSPIVRLEAGNLSKDILQPVNGRWTFEDNDIQLRIGDILNYWVFVQVNGMGHRLDNLSTVIKEILPTTSAWVNDAGSIYQSNRPTIQSTSYDSNRDSNHNSNYYEESKPDYHQEIARSSTQPPIYGQSNVHYEQTTQRYNQPTRRSTYKEGTTTNARTSMQSLPPITCDCDCDCNQSQFATITSQLNVTLMQLNSLHDKLSPLNSQVESMTELLQELIKDMDIGTRLLLTGQQPPGTNPVEAIRQLITEKLQLTDLDENILQAYYTDQGIMFEMSSPIDKKRILFRAMKKLKNSSYKIEDPERKNFNSNTLTSSTTGGSNTNYNTGSLGGGGNSGVRQQRNPKSFENIYSLDVRNLR